jgi:hypothetical protein
MANKTISMSKLRQIIKLYSQAMGKRKIGIRLGMSKNTVTVYVERFKALKTTWDELSKLTDFELNKLFLPPQETPANPKLQELFDFFPEMEKQLRRRGMTIFRQFEEFKRQHPDGYALTVNKQSQMLS